MPSFPQQSRLKKHEEQKIEGLVNMTTLSLRGKECKYEELMVLGRVG